MALKEHHRIASVVLACVSIVILLVSSEIMIIVFTPFGTGPLNPLISKIITTIRSDVLNDQQIATFDSVDGVFIGRRMIPNISVNKDRFEFREIYTTNSKGYYDYEDAEAVADHCFTVAVLGDSFTFGTGSKLEETYGALLEKKFDLRVYKMGVGAHSNIEAYLHIQKNNPGADLIILGLWLPKMVWRDQQFLNEYFDRVKDRLDEPGVIQDALSQGKDQTKVLPLAGRIKSYLKQNSSLYLFFSNNRYIFGAFTKLFANAGVIDQEFSLRPQDHPYAVEQMGLGYIYPEGFQPSLQDSYFNVTFRILEQLKKYAQNEDVKLVVLLIPSKAQVYWPVFSRVHPKLKEQFEPDLPNVIMSKFLEDKKIYYLDLLPLLRAHVDPSMTVWNNENELFFGIDAHWTKKAHALTANYLAEYLSKANLISECKS